MKVIYKEKVCEVSELLIVIPECIFPQRVDVKEVEIFADRVFVGKQEFKLVTK